MREIKFRAWDVERGKYRSGTDNLMMDLSGRLYWQFGYGAPDMLPKDASFVIEQFTGLQDANSVDIYEGDIIRWDYMDSGGRSFIGLVVAGPSFEIITDDWGIAHYSNGFAIQFLDGSGYTCFDGRSVSVIGNIHEHPHLLEEA